MPTVKRQVQKQTGKDGRPGDEVRYTAALDVEARANEREDRGRSQIHEFLFERHGE